MARISLTFDQHYQLCQALHKRAESLLQQRPTYEQLHGPLSQALGFEFGEGALKRAKSITGVDWTPLPRARKGSGKQRNNDIVILGNAILQLYNEWKLPLPERLVGLVERASNLLEAYSRVS